MRISKENNAYRNTELRILKAITRSFSKKDLIAAKVKDLLKDSDVSPATFYVHYDSLPDFISKNQKLIQNGINLEVKRAISNNITLERFYRNVLLFFYRNKERLALIIETSNIRSLMSLIDCTKPIITSKWNDYGIIKNNYIYRQFAMNFIYELKRWHNEQYSIQKIDHHISSLSKMTIMAPKIYIQLV